MRLLGKFIFFGFLNIFLLKGFESFPQDSLQFIQEPPSVVHFISEVGLKLNCSAVGTPKPVTQWKCGDTQCSTISGLRFIDETSLTFMPFTAEGFRPDVHDSTYKCVAGNSFGTITKDVAVKAFVPQRIEPRVSTVKGVRDYPTLLKCEFPEDVADVSAWLRDDVYTLLPNEFSNKYLILPDGHLLIWQVTSQDFYSKFQCRVKEKLREKEYLSSQGKILPLRVEELNRPIIQQTPQAVSVAENELAVLPCVAFGNPKPLIQWYKRISGGPLLPVSSSFDDYRFETGNKIIIRDGILTIPSAKKLHAGSYVCNATNSFGTEQRETNLYITTPLSLTLTPSVLTVDLGKSAVFTCSSNDETVQIEWLRNGVLLRSSSDHVNFLRNNRVNITRVSKEDQGIYQCIGRNSVEIQQKSAQLYLGDSSPILLYIFIDQTVLPGNVVSVKCKATGWPLPQVSWFLDGFVLPQSERFTVGQIVVDDIITSYVNITSVSPSDSGEYTCLFRNKAGEASHSNRINVYGDLLVRPMSESVGVFGKSFKLKCPVGGYPIDRITWSKDNIKLPKNVHQKVTVDGVLSIENMMKHDAGTYQCTAYRQSQIVHGLVDVNVVVLPSITPFQFGFPVAGNRVTVLCSLTSDLTNMTIEWYKDNSPILSNNTHTNKFFKITRIDEFTSSLTISSLSPTFNGNYTCKISSIHSHVSASWTSPLNVNVPPRISKFDFEDTIIEGMKVQSLCFSQGDLPMKFKWYRDGSTPLISQPGFEITSFEETSEILTIQNVSTEMSGVISCEVTNRAGKAIHSSNLVVKVPPKFVIEPHDITGSFGSSLKIQCAADGKPVPEVKWLQEIRTGHTEFREIENTPGIRNLNGTLRLTHLTKEHSGMYLVCQASNDIGPPISKRIQITITAPPRIKPTQSKVIAEIGQMTKLRCSVEGDPPIKITWKLNGQEIFKHHITSNDSQSELTINKVKLEDRGEYACFTLNKFGHDYIVISLLVQEQPRSPSNLRMLAHTSRSITLAWSVVAYIELYVLDFIISYRHSGEKWATEFVPGDQSTVTIRNLLPFTAYEFTISARNQIGTSTPAEPLKVTTSQEEPSQPRNVVVEQPSGINDLRISWIKPEYPNGIISHYTIFYYKNMDSYGKVKYRNVPGTFSSLTIRGVDPFTHYSFLIQAVNGAGSGQNSTPFQIQTREGKPKYSPQEVRCQALSSKSLQISWKPPRVPQYGIIIGFRVNVDLVDPDEKFSTNSEFESEVTGVSTVIQGLREFSKYNIQVAAFTSEGSGPPSRHLFCETKESFPNEPSDIKVVEQSGYVIVSWFYRERENETLRKYHIYVRTRAEGQILKKSVPANTKSYELRHLSGDRIYEACVTAENSKGEGKPSRSVTFKVPRADPNANYPLTILSFANTLNVPWKSEVLLECYYTALTKAMVVWKKGNTILSQKNDTLHIKSLNVQDSGNYTCTISDGSYLDQIVHVVNVQVPPSVPILEVRRTLGNNSATLSWKFDQKDCCGILGFTFNYRQVGGEWEEEINLEKRRSTYEFIHRECFSKTYEVFLTAYNKIGTSLPSDTIQIVSEGYFLLPTYSNTVHFNSTTITLNLTAWNIFDCEDGLLVAEYKNVEENIWILAKMTNLSEVIYLNDLSKEKDYIVRIRVQSGDNEIEKEFTVPFSQSSILSSENLSGIYQGFTVILPMALAVVGVGLVVVGTLLFRWKKRNPRNSKNNSNRLPFNSYAMHEKLERDYTIIREKNLSDSDQILDNSCEVNPYATFDAKPMTRYCENTYQEPIYGHGNMMVPVENDYGYKHHRRSRSRSSRPRGESIDHDHFLHDGPNSSSVYYGPETTTMIISDKRKSLPRTRQSSSRCYELESNGRDYDEDCILERSSNYGDYEEKLPHIQMNGAKKVKRRSVEPDGYTCPHDYMFINV